MVIQLYEDIAYISDNTGSQKTMDNAFIMQSKTISKQ